MVVLENVPRLLTLDNGAVHRHVSRSLATLGYLVHYRILNSAEYGAPQSRKRLFYVAVRPGHAFRWPEPVPSDKRRVLEDALEPEPKFIARTPTLTCWTPIRVWQDRGRVRITRPREMARLQGVPDALPVPASEQAANSLFGNMVCVDVVQGVFESLVFFREKKI